MGLRALVQVLLGMFAFAILVLLLTANSDEHGTLWADVGGVAVGAPALLLGLLVALVALVVLSWTGHRQKPIGSGDRPFPTVIRFECSECGWAGSAPTLEEAKHMGRRHLDESHGGVAPSQEGSVKQ